MATRCGLIALAGRPNVGKSTLANRLVGEKIAIVSDRPQTTRRAIRGVSTGDGWQLVLTDLPGVQRPRDELTARMQRRVERELSESDAALIVINGAEGLGPGDRFIAALIRKAGIPIIGAVNKADRMSKEQMVEVLSALADLEIADAIVPVSARRGSGVETLTDQLVALLPEGPFLFPPEARSDQPFEVELAELVREQVLRRTRQEVPHAIEVKVDEIGAPKQGVIVVAATVLVESGSQQAIVVGRGGRMIRLIGTAARKEIERLTGDRCHLDLTVSVRKDWRGDPRFLDSLGID